jgi:hypothetical protein
VRLSRNAKRSLPGGKFDVRIFTRRHAGSIASPPMGTLRNTGWDSRKAVHKAIAAPGVRPTRRLELWRHTRERHAEFKAD